MEFDNSFPGGPVLGSISLEKVFGPMEDVKLRLIRAVKALEAGRVEYAIIGGFAVAAHVTRVDPQAVRVTRDVDILLRRGDLSRATEALAPAGFVFRHARGVTMFLDGPDGSARDALQVIFAGEKVREECATATPELSESEAGTDFQVVSLPALVRMKLNSFRRKDQTHLDDLIELGLIDESWPAKYPPELAARLQHLLDTPQS